MTVWAVLAAAGSGERLNADRPKAFVRLGALPLLAESLGRLDGCDWVDQIVVAVPVGWEEPAILLAEEIGASKVTACVTGGATRAASVRAALAEVPAGTAAVLVHDAARPLVTDDVVGRLLAALGEGWDGAIPALPLADTVKRVRAGAVLETVDRSELVAAQTPQAFVPDVLRRALASGEDGTDCSSLVEAAGGRVRVVDGERRLLKVTTPADLDQVERWLAG